MSLDQIPFKLGKAPAACAPTPVASSVRREHVDAVKLAIKPVLAGEDTTETVEKLRLRKTQLAQIQLWLENVYATQERLDLEVVYNRVRAYATAVDEIDCRTLVRNFNLLRKSVTLQHALLVGGEDLLDEETGRKTRFYKLALIAGGGLGMLVDGYLLKGNVLIPAVLKAARQDPLPLVSDPSFTEARRNRQAIRDAHAAEIVNARRILAKPMKNLAKPLLITEADSSGQSQVVYERISDKQNRSRNYAIIAVDPTIPPSAKLHGFSYALDGLHAMHIEGRVHGDFKEHNAVMDENEQAVVIDFGSVLFPDEEITFEEGIIPQDLKLRKVINTSKGKRSIAIPTTPRYYDNQLTRRLYLQNKSLTLADRYAVAQALHSILAAAGIINSAKAELFTNTKLQSKLSGDLSGYPPPALLAITELMSELADVDAAIQRPLNVIAEELRTLAKCLENELDPLYAQAFGILA
ncbi:MAG: hypothetical protein HY817_01300 [Candidatus Abawacabacteria bacterium]|nr:hypothetical protein [Candidatus Abawacabacteria bacterium]